MNKRNIIYVKCLLTTVSDFHAQQWTHTASNIWEPRSPSPRRV